MSKKRLVKTLLKAAAKHEKRLEKGRGPDNLPMQVGEADRRREAAEFLRKVADHLNTD